MDSHKTHKSVCSDGQTLGHNECCSVPSPRWVPACNLCEGHTFVKHKKTVTQL